ncbi:MAG TPA: GNAT family N-acetyltransferase, partial [Thermoleophilaceae bacterium]|nr:GNAT family N-acetyltransferase [Thermoleophilaceae bacterium]
VAQVPSRSASRSPHSLKICCADLSWAHPRIGMWAATHDRWLTSCMELTIRDATQSDADGVAHLLADLGYPISTEVAAAHIERFVCDPASRIQVAEGGDGLIGLVATHIVPRLDDDGLTCRITDIVVSGARRRAGVGSALLAAAEQEARRVGAPRLDLSSGEWRADAHAFYTRHGFDTPARTFTKRLRPD